MTGFNHTLAGAIIAVIVPVPFVPLVALASHFMMDALPHFGESIVFRPYNRAFKGLLVIDAILCFTALFFAWWLFPEHKVIITIGTFFAAAPDFLWLLDSKVKWLRGFFRFAKKIQWKEIPEGWTYELLYSVFMVMALIFLK